MKDLLKAIERVPLHFREGPYSPIALVYLLSYAAFLICTSSHALSSFQDIKEDVPNMNANLLFTLRCGAGLYGAIILAFVVVVSGWWPLVSYTITSWNLLWLRMVFAAFGLNDVARLFKFPCLVGCSITVIIWWVVLVPLLHHLIEEKQKRVEFWKFNTSFLLLNVHLLNLPLAGLEFFLSSSKLVFFDLWIGLLVAYVYIIFYLVFLDSKGIHLYIILTPRTHLCFLSYSIILSIYFLCYQWWNSCV